MSDKLYIIDNKINMKLYIQTFYSNMSFKIDNQFVIFCQISIGFNMFLHVETP